MGDDRDTECATCGNPIPPEDTSTSLRVPCRKCGSTARIFRAHLSEGIIAADSLMAEVVRLSAETSATAMAISTGTMPNMDGFWREASALKEVMLRDQGSDVALRAIASGAFDPGEKYPFDAKTRNVTRFVAEEILRERQDAKDRTRVAIAEASERRRGLLAWLDRVIGWARGVFGA